MNKLFCVCTLYKSLTADFLRIGLCFMFWCTVSCTFQLLSEPQSSENQLPDEFEKIKIGE